MSETHAHQPFQPCSCNPAFAGPAAAWASMSPAAKPSLPPVHDVPPHAAAAELCRDMKLRLRPPARELLDEEITPRAYFQRLIEADLLPEARRVLAHTLPKRRALWWGCLCAMESYGEQPPAEALSAVLRFVIHPTEANRRATHEAGKRARPNTLGGCLASAAFFSGGSVSLPGLPEVAPRPFVTGRLVGVAVYLAAVTRDAAAYKQALREYLALGLEVARGENLWYASREIVPARLEAGGPEHALGGMHRKTPKPTPHEHPRPKPHRPRADKPVDGRNASGEKAE